MPLRIVEISSIYFDINRLSTFSLESDLETTVMNSASCSKEKLPSLNYMWNNPIALRLLYIPSFPWTEFLFDFWSSTVSSLLILYSNEISFYVGAKSNYKHPTIIRIRRTAQISVSEANATCWVINSHPTVNILHQLHWCEFFSYNIRATQPSLHIIAYQ
jgi:hypothetical protein